MDPIQYKQANEEGELRQILEIQSQNSRDVLNPDEVQKEGFVTVRHDLDILKKMNDRCAHILAKDGQTVAGYALCMHPEFRNEIPIIAAMFNRVEKLLGGKPYIVMGQICIAKDYRKRGIFRRLYEEMLRIIKPEFERIITEVDDTNQRSLLAHYAVGFRDLEVYEADGRTWHLIELS